MVLVRGADKVVIGEVHHVELLLHHTGSAVHKFFWGEALGLGLLLILFAVLVSAGLEKHFIALHPLKAGNAVGQHGVGHIANVGFAGRVRNGRCDIIASF